MDIKIKLTALLTAFILFFMLPVATLCGAWFFEDGMVSSFGISCGIGAEHFESGNGTEQSPYEIKYPVQLFNFAWLQNMGRFNGGSTVYFCISTDIDMAGYTLPPIGTAEYPFVGNLDGGGHTVSNLTVSTSARELTDPPVSLGGSDLTYVGVFGVVGNLDGQSRDISHTGVNSLTLHKSIINGEFLTQDYLAGYLDVGVSELQISVIR